MFERYNEKARRALFFARYEASKLGSRDIQSEHVLLGILREGEETVLELLSRFDVKPEDLRREIEGDRVFVERVSSTAELPLSQDTKHILTYAATESEQMLHKMVGSEHLILGLLRRESSLAARILAHAGLDLDRVRKEVVAMGEERQASARKMELPLLDRYGRDLTLLAEKGELPPLIGREAEVERLVRVMSMRTRCHPVLVGEPGVGKTAIVEGLAQRMVRNQKIPAFLAPKRILTLDAYNKSPGEDRPSIRTVRRALQGQTAESSFDAVPLARIFSELAGKNVIVYVNDFHLLLEAGWSATGLLKRGLLPGEWSLIGATTPRHLHVVERHSALRRHLQFIRIDPPSTEETFQILRGTKDLYEEFHKVRYPDSVLRHAVLRSDRYVTGCQPEKAITVIDEAGAWVRQERVEAEGSDEVPEVTESDVDEVIASVSGTEPESMTS